MWLFARIYILFILIPADLQSAIKYLKLLTGTISSMSWERSSLPTLHFAWTEMFISIISKNNLQNNYI